MRKNSVLWLASLILLSLLCHAANCGFWWKPCFLWPIFEAGRELEECEDIIEINLKKLLGN